MVVVLSSQSSLNVVQFVTIRDFYIQMSAGKKYLFSDEKNLSDINN
jgi:hypothetical protein